MKIFTNMSNNSSIDISTNDENMNINNNERCINIENDNENRNSVMEKNINETKKEIIENDITEEKIGSTNMNIICNKKDNNEMNENKDMVKNEVSYNGNDGNNEKIDIIVQERLENEQINNRKDSTNNTNKECNDYYSNKQSIYDDVNNKFKPTIFETVLNGPRGPDVRLHRHNVIVGILKLLTSLFVTAGIILLSVIMLCITINVGYVCVQIDDINSFVQMIFFVFYSNALYKITVSIWRTYLRLIHSIIDCRFGSNVSDIFVKRVLGYFISEKIAHMTLPEKYKTHPKDWYEKINLIIFIIFVVIVLFPFPLIAICYGYWEITGVFCLMFVGGGAITILGVNLFSRCVLYLKFFRRLDEFFYNAPSYIDIKERINNQTSYLRIAYCTTNSFEGGVNCVNYIMDRLIIIIVEISVASFFFGSFDPDVIKLSFMIGILLILIPIRCRKQLYKYICKVFEKMNILSKGRLENYEMKYKMKINKQMNEIYKQYQNFKKKTYQYAFDNKNHMNEEQTGWNLVRIKAVNQRNVSEKGNLSDDIHVDLSSPYINEINNSSTNDNFNNDTNITNSISTLRINRRSRFSDNMKRNSEIEVKAEGEENENATFYNLINSNNRKIYRKALLKWDIETLTSWKGCLTVFYVRFLKNVIGISFMAILNYYRYSNKSEIETKNNLLIDIFTYLTFLILLLGQDIIQLIPADSTLISMKGRKIIFIVLLTFELILIIGMYTIIKNNYIPMAFMIIAYSNFIIYPDPRYTWDDENVKRKTFFDLFKPTIDLRSEISYRHIGKSKGYISKDSKLTISDENLPTNPKYNRFDNSKVDDTAIINDINDNSFINDSIINNSNENSIISNSNENSIINDSIINNLNDTIINSNETLNNNDGIIKSLTKTINNKDISLGSINLKGEVVDNIKKNPESELNKTVKTIIKEMQYKRNTRARYNSLAILFATFIVVVISILIGILVANSHLHEDVPYTNNTGIFKQKPAICQWRGDGISINEFSSLAYACYYNTLDDISHSLSFCLPKSSTNTFKIGDNSINSKSGVHFVDFINEEKNVIVVAIRGTKTFEDLFQDVYIWSASALIQMSGYFGTFIKFWPRDTIATLVNFIVRQFTNLQLLYWIDVEKHITDLKENTNYTLYLTGHSLGGGVAGVISAHLDIPAITFSSPGLGYSYKTYDIELKKLIRNFVNIVPMSDPIPFLDSQIGQVQNIECNTEQPLACHSIFNTIDTLNRMCGEQSVYRYWDKNAEKVIDGVPVTYELEV